MGAALRTQFAAFDAYRMKFHPVAEIFPMMSAGEFVALKADIAENGLREPIWTYGELIIDGRNRFAACEALGVEPHFQEWNGKGSLVQFVVSLNLNRRHLTSSQKAVIALDIEKYLAKESKQRKGGRPAESYTANKGLNGHKPVEIFPPVSGKSREQAAAIVGTNDRYVSDAKRIEKKAPDLLNKVRNGSATIPEVKREIKERERQERREQTVEQGSKSASATERYELRHGDLATELNTLDASSVNVIITDPPYSVEFLPLYEVLAEQSARVLKDGGLCVVMCGHSYLPDIYAMMSRHLTYHWTAAYLTPGGQSVQLFPRKVNTFWKPLLIYSKGKYDGKWFGDVAKSSVNDNDKEHHDWGQSVSGMLDVVSRFTEENDLVLDPFVGAGTTGVACLKLNRRFIGIDRDEKSVSIARGRLAGCLK